MKQSALEKGLKSFDKDVIALNNAQGTLKGLREKEANLKQDRKDLEVKFEKTQIAKDDMSNKFEKGIDQHRTRVNHKNKVLEMVLEVRTGELEKKEVQVRELVQRSGLE